jgi:hypothetical protein
MYGQLPCDRPWAEVYVRSFLLYLHINETIVNRHSLLFLIIMMMVERRKCGTRPPGTTTILHISFDLMLPMILPA